MTNQDTTSIYVSQNANSDTPEQSCITNDTSIDELDTLVWDIEALGTDYCNDRPAPQNHDEAVTMLKALISDQVAKARIDGEKLTLQWALNQLSFDGSDQDVKYIEDRLATLNGVKNK